MRLKLDEGMKASANEYQTSISHHQHLKLESLENNKIQKTLELPWVTSLFIRHLFQQVYNSEEM